MFRLITLQLLEHSR